MPTTTSREAPFLSNDAHSPFSSSPSRSRLDRAIRSMLDWSEEDQAIFVAIYTTNKSSEEVAKALGMTPTALKKRRSEILRRFMRAANIEAKGADRPSLAEMPAQA